MTSSIRTCPSCKALLLQETMQCPECNYVLDKARYEQLDEATPGGAGSWLVANQDHCPTCGESVQHGMVRCWNCGSFMKEEIAALYQQMQAKPAPVIFSDQPAGETIYSVEDPGDLVISDGQAARGDDDFELQGDFATDPPADSSDTYSLSDAPAEAAESETAVAETTAPPEEDEKPAADESAKSDPLTPTDDETVQSHSVATGGDALLEIALEEEAETSKRRSRPLKKQSKAAREISGFLVFCPNGHRIEVHDRHRGKAGRCPKCKAVFIVPIESAEEKQAAEKEQAAAEAATAKQPEDKEAAGAYTRWMTDLHLHTVNPEKLRLKPGSLEKDFQPVDIGFCPDGILLATLVSGGGLFGMGGGQKPEAVREEMLTRLREEVPVDDLPIPQKEVLEKSLLEQLSIDQPVVYEHESMFVGVPVFGAGRIAIRLPKTEQNPLPRFVSFDLTGFRRFSKILEEMYGVEEFGLLHEIPPSNEFTERTCHYSEEKFRSLDRDDFYQRDPNFKLKLVGRKCQACGLVVSEDSRKKEKIGGSAGRGIARAKCPKCSEKFGDISLFDLVEEQTPAPSPDEQAAESTDDAPETSDTKTP